MPTPILPIQDGESGVSVRTKLNTLISEAGDAASLQGVDVQASVPADGQILVYSAANSRYEPASKLFLTTDAQNIGGVKTFSSSPLVPDIARGTKDDKAANTQFVQEALESASWRFVDAVVTNGSETEIDFLASTYTDLPIDGIRWRISNLISPANGLGRIAVMRVNDLLNNRGANTWDSSGVFTSNDSNSVAYATSRNTWNEGPFLYASSTSYSSAYVDGELNLMGGSTGLIVGRIKEQRLVRNVPNTFDLFQNVDWHMWSAPGSYTNQTLQSLRVLVNSIDPATALRVSGVTFTAGMKIEWFIKTVNT